MLGRMLSVLRALLFHSHKKRGGGSSTAWGALPCAPLGCCDCHRPLSQTSPQRGCGWCWGSWCCFPWVNSPGSSPHPQPLPLSVPIRGAAGLGVAWRGRGTWIRSAARAPAGVVLSPACPLGAPCLEEFGGWSPGGGTKVLVSLGRDLARNLGASLAVCSGGRAERSQNAF